MYFQATHIYNDSYIYVVKWKSLSRVGFSRAEFWIPSPGDFPNPGTEPRSPALWTDSLPAEPQGEPKNTGVGRLSHLQGIFLSQELNWGLLHCRWFLYQLNYQGSPYTYKYKSKFTYRLYTYMLLKSEWVKVAQSCLTLWPMDAGESMEFSKLENWTG